MNIYLELWINNKSFNCGIKKSLFSFERKNLSSKVAVTFRYLSAVADSYCCSILPFASWPVL